MSEAERPDPDAILAQMKREKTAATRGKLKIFFGMAPGVGKTYAMLQAAQQKLQQGTEVVIGIVETHAVADRVSRNKTRGDGSRRDPHMASRSRGCR